MSFIDGVEFWHNFFHFSITYLPHLNNFKNLNNLNSLSLTFFFCLLLFIYYHLFLLSILRIGWSGKVIRFYLNFQFFLFIYYQLHLIFLSACIYHIFLFIILLSIFRGGRSGTAVFIYSIIIYSLFFCQFSEVGGVVRRWGRMIRFYRIWEILSPGITKCTLKSHQPKSSCILSLLDNFGSAVIVMDTN